MPSASIDAEPEKAAAMNLVMAMPTFARSAAMIARVEPSVLICSNLSHGDVSERPKVLVSKTSVRESAPRVQIPPSPRESKKEPDKQALFFFADDFGVSGSRLVIPKLKPLAVSHRSGDNFAAKRGARVQIPPSPRGRGVSKDTPDRDRPRALRLIYIREAEGGFSFATYRFGSE